MSDTTDYTVPMRELVSQLIRENNDRADRLRSAGNSAALLAEVRDEKETEDVNILDYREMREKALAEVLSWEKDIEEYIRNAGLVDAPTVDVEKETAAWKAQHSTVKNMMAVLTSLAGDDGTRELPEIKGIPGKSGTTSGNSGGTGITRPRFQSIRYSVAGSDKWTEVFQVDEKDDGTREQKTSLTILALALNKTYKSNVSASDLHGPLFEEAGTKDLKSLKGKPVAFAFSVGDVNVIVEATPRVD